MRNLFFLTVVAALIPSARADEIRHRFLAVDESRAQLLYVDQLDPSRGWTLKLPCKHRDLQLVGNHRVLLSSPEGYREFDLSDRRIVKQVQGYQGGMTARRRPDGRTILCCNFQGVTVYDLSPDDKLLRKANFKTGGTRVLRQTPQDTLLFGSGPQLFEGDWNGRLLKTINLPGTKTWAYQASRSPDGHLLVPGGYNTTFYVLDPAGNVARSIGGPDSPEAQPNGYHFFGGFQLLHNGNLVLCNWTGHGVDDSRKGTQILEFDPAGKIVWKWHDPDRAGSINGVLVMDNLDPAVLNDEIGGVLGPVK
jgi:hypothetical protein